VAEPIIEPLLLDSDESAIDPLNGSSKNNIIKFPDPAVKD